MFVVTFSSMLLDFVTVICNISLNTPLESLFMMTFSLVFLHNHSSQSLLSFSDLKTSCRYFYFFSLTFSLMFFSLYIPCLAIHHLSLLVDNNDIWSSGCLLVSHTAFKVPTNFHQVFLQYNSCCHFTFLLHLVIFLHHSTYRMLSRLLSLARYSTASKVCKWSAQLPLVNARPSYTCLFCTERPLLCFHALMSAICLCTFIIASVWFELHFIH